MTTPPTDLPITTADDPTVDEEDDLAGPACVMVFNASDPSGAGGLAADVSAMASVGAHALPVVTGAYARDTGEIFDHFPFDEEAVAEQARAVLEDVAVQVIKVGFVGTPENISAIAEIAADYADVPLVAYMPNLSWWDEDKIDEYLDAFRELMLPQTTVLVGHHSTLRRWLLPDWNNERNPTPRDIAKAAGEMGVAYTLVTGIPLPDQHVDNVLTSPQATLTSEKFELFEAVFTGAGDTLSAALAALLASGTELGEAASEALNYLDRCLDGGFRPGMGHVLPDRMFWAQPEDEDGNGVDEEVDEETLKAIAAWKPLPMTQDTDLNQQLFARAQKVIPGGVNSPVRAFKAVGGTPRFVTKAQGAYFWDANGQQFTDYIGSWGPMILGHGHPAVVEAVQKAALEGFSFGAPTEREVELAEEILKLVPSMDMVRLVSSGTEAGMSAIRLARGATGRKKIIKFEGCYHGHADALLVKAGSGLATFGNPTSAGVPPEVVQHTLVLEYNNLTQLEEAFALHGADTACLIIEPIAGNMNFVRASVSFMQRCRELCSQHGALLVFDEVMTGLRVGLRSAQGVYAKSIPGFAPDMTVLGKVIGGGMPLAAFGGSRAVMEQLAPLGPVYQAGTLSGNPVATACGLATLREVQKPGFYEDLSRMTRLLVNGLTQAALNADVPFCGDSEGGMFGFFLLDTLPSNYGQVMKTSNPRFNHLFHGLLDRGVYIAPALYEAGFVSAAHTEADIAATVAAASEVFQTLPKA